MAMQQNRSVDLSAISSDPNYVPSSPIAQPKKGSSSTSSGVSTWFAKTFTKKSAISSNSTHTPAAAAVTSESTTTASSAQTTPQPPPKKSSSFAFWKKKDAVPGTIKAVRSPQTQSRSVDLSAQIPPPTVPSPSISTSTSHSGVLYRPELSATAQPHYDGSLPDPPPPVDELPLPSNSRSNSAAQLSAPHHQPHPHSYSEADASIRERSSSFSQTGASNPSSYYNSTYYSSALSNLTAFQPSSSRRGSASAAPPSPSLDDPIPSPAPASSPSANHIESSPTSMSRPSSAASNHSGSSTPVHGFTSTTSINGLTSSSSSNSSSKSQSMKLSNFRKFLSDDTLDMDALRKASWNGIPPLVRSISWKILLGYLPANLARRETTLAKRREEYRGYVEQYYDATSGTREEEDDQPYQPNISSTNSRSEVFGTNGPRSEAEFDILRQIRQDVPRTAPGIPFFKLSRTQRSLERLLYIFAVRHTASGYVQGMNDVSTPFYCVFLSEYLYPNAVASHSSTSSSETFQPNPNSSFHSASHLPPETDPTLQGTDVLSDPYSSSIVLSHQQYLDLESDVFWCLSKLLDRIQDNYTFAQPGIQRMVYKMRELVQRIDGSLDAHLDKHHVTYIHFAFRWINCLLMREMPMWCIIRIWDTYLSEDSAATAVTGASSTLSSSGASSGATNNNSSSSGPTLLTPQDHYNGFRAFHIYMCTAFLIRFSSELKKMEFQELVLFLQKLPTEKWGMKEVETLLAQAFIYKSWFHSSPHQLK